MSDYECVYTRAECHHRGCKCSECPITDLVCDEFNDCLDLSYQQGKTDAIEELKKLSDDLPSIDCNHWTSRDSEAISKLFALYEEKKS